MPLSTLLLSIAAAPPQDAPAPAAAEWRQFRGDAGQRGVAPGRLADELTTLWTYEAEGAITSSPVVADGVAFFGSDDQHLHAVDLATGERRWTHGTEDMIEAPPTVHGDAVYVGSNDGYLYALDRRTGELRWRFEGGAEFKGAAVPVAGPDGSTRIVAGNYDSSVYCIDAETGELVWSYATADRVNGTPAIDEEGRIVFGGCDQVLHVISAADGSVVSRIELGEACHIAGSVALEGGRAYFGHYGNEFVCVDLDEGEVVWRVTDPSQAFFSSPALTEDLAIFGGRDRELHCVDKATGEERWAFKTRRSVDGSPVACGDKVVFGGNDGWLYVLRIADGEPVWTYEIGRSILGSPAVVDGKVLIGANDSRMYCFGPAPAGGGPR